MPELSDFLSIDSRRPTAWSISKVMNDAFPRCAVPGSSCRLLQLETPGARPVWAVLDAAGARHFSGEITLHVVPQVRAWFISGELYAAERDGDPAVTERLLALGVLGADDLTAGSVQVGDVVHLGRLFDRVPHLDRDRVELALEILTGEVVGEIADHVVDEISIASYRQHPNGLAKWQKRPSAAPAPAPAAEDEALVAEYEASLPTGTDLHRVATAHDPQHTQLEHTQLEHTQLEHTQLGHTQLEHEHDSTVLLPEPTAAGLPEPVVLLDPVVEQQTMPPAPAVDQALPPASFECSIASFESSMSSVLEHIGPTTDPAAPTLLTPPVFELSVADILAELAGEVPSSITGPDGHEPSLQPDPAVEPASPAPTVATAGAPAEPVWQIDDRVDWHVDTTDAAAPIPDPTVGMPIGAGPVVEFDLSHLLTQAAGGATPTVFDTTPTTADPRITPTLVSSADAAAGQSPVADDEVRAAVQAALAEIAAATRTGGDHEVPSILMQTALADLAETADTSATPFEATMEQPAIVRPALPDRFATASSATTTSSAASASSTPAAPSTATGPAGPAEQRDSDDASGRPSQEMPATGGGLRRLLGTRKP